jgi:hypothetical protein
MISFAIVAADVLIGRLLNDSAGRDGGSYNFSADLAGDAPAVQLIFQ